MSEKFRRKYRTTSHRLTGFDYASDGAYFITIVTKNRDHFFGGIINNEMVLNKLGKIAETEWKRTAEIRENIRIDEFVIMPNHIHGILWIENNPYRRPVETNCNLSLQRINRNKNNNAERKPLKHGTSQTIGSIVRGFKIGVTKYARENTNIHDVWQRNYHDRIIRNDNELNRIREYIIKNPEKWERDRNNQGLWL